MLEVALVVQASCQISVFQQNRTILNKERVFIVTSFACKSSECDAGKYGKECRQTCSDHCAEAGNPCDHVTGECTYGCDPGYYTDTCILRKFNLFYGNSAAKTLVGGTVKPAN